MPMELLREIAAGPFPFTVENEGSIDKLRVLHAAGLVLATIPPAGTVGQPALVREITGLGRATLKARKP